MKPPPFDWVAPPTLHDCLAELAGSDGDVRVLSGGQSLMPLLALRMARPTRLVDVNKITELAGLRVEPDGSGLVVGALVRHRTLERDPAIARACPALRTAARHIGHIGIRNRGTFGGSIAHADPAAELPAIAVALEGVVRCRSAERGSRDVAASDFVQGAYTTSAEPDEMVVSVRLPLRSGQGVGFAEVAPRSGDFATAGAVCRVVTDGLGVLHDVRLVIFGELTGLHLLDAAIVEGLPAHEAAAEGRGLAERIVRQVDAPAADRHRIASVLADVLAGAASEAGGRTPSTDGSRL